MMIRDELLTKLDEEIRTIYGQQKAALAEIKRLLGDVVQTYPTADAYEVTCAALHKWRDKAKAALTIVEAAASKIETLAFEMEAPNAYTPQFVQIAIEMRQALSHLQGDQ